MTHEELNELLAKAGQENIKGKYGEAENLANEVLAELDKTSHSFEERKSVERLHANALLAIAVSIWHRGNYDAALEKAEQVLAIAEEYTLLEVLQKHGI